MADGHPAKSHRAGLERLALDLHVHTPASKDWTGGDVTPEQLVQRAIEAGLDGIAIADHETGEWVDRLKEAAQGTPLVIIPAVELNSLAGNEGIHLLCLFDLDVTSADIDRFLTTIGVLRGAGGRRERGTALKGPLEVLDELEAFGGIAILAHCQSGKGALGAMRGDLRTRLVQHRVVLAVEAPAEEYWDVDKRSTRKRTYDLLDGSDPNYKRELAVYQASDNPATSAGHGHGLDGIGSRFTYFYVERPLALESLRQCFVDRDARIMFPAVDTVPESSTAFGVPGIRRLTVTGGFLDGLDVEFHGGLTTVLGPKGSGKSIIVELLRFGLDQEPTQAEILKDHQTKLEKQLGNYGRVKVTIRSADGTEQIVEREFNPAADNPFHGTTFPPNEMLPCHFLSQNEIVRIAESEEEQIRFIDSFFDFRAHQRAIDDVRKQLAALDKQVADQIRARKAAAALKTEETNLRAEIAKKDAELKSPVFGKFQEAQKKMQWMTRAATSAADVVSALHDAKARVEAVPASPDLPPEFASDPLAQQTRDIAEGVRADALRRIDETITAIETRSRQVSDKRDEWRPSYDAIADEYSKEAQKSGGDVPALSQARTRFVARLNDVETKLGAVEQTAALLKPTVDRRNSLLADLRTKMQAYTQARKDRCKWFEEKSDERIRASVAAGSNRADFREQLNSMKRGSYLSASEVDKVVEGCSPDDFVNALLRYDLTRNQHDLGVVATASGLPAARIAALAEFLFGDDGVGYERLLELQYRATPTDRPEIAFRLEDGTYSPLAELSTGQKCTALLMMALCEGDAPIVVDQPEDSLDIRSIWDDMCLRLRRSKRERQFLFTTHNSSLAVASDSDKFVVLTADARHGEAVLAGAIDRDDVREEVIRLLEGGPGTYFLKQRKYNISDPWRRPGQGGT